MISASTPVSREKLLPHEFGLPAGQDTASLTDAKGLHDFSRSDKYKSRMASTFWILRRNSFSARRRSAGMQQQVLDQFIHKGADCVRGLLR